MLSQAMTGVLGDLSRCSLLLTGALIENGGTVLLYDDGAGPRFFHACRLVHKDFFKLQLLQGR